MRFTKIPVNAFSTMQLNAGMLLRNFDPETGTYEGNAIIGATSGGINASAVPTFSDMGDGVDNCPLNVKELKRVDSWECTMSGTLITVDHNTTQLLLGVAKVQGVGDPPIPVVPSLDMEDAQFGDIWWVGDYTDKNSDENGGFLAVKISNALSTGGFSVQSSDKSRGTFPFTFTGHVSINAQDVVPFEVYIQRGV